MTSEKVNMYLFTNHKFFPADKMYFIREKLLELPEENLVLLTAVDLKDPTLILVASIFGGSF